jgi:hypothetical protein
MGKKDDLPKGKTCKDCYNFKGCASFLGRKGNERKCDWSPSHFVEGRL